jgi:hypothetical protein
MHARLIAACRKQIFTDNNSVIIWNIDTETSFFTAIVESIAAGKTDQDTECDVIPEQIVFLIFMSPLHSYC